MYYLGSRNYYTTEFHFKCNILYHTEETSERQGRMCWNSGPKDKTSRFLSQL